MIFRRHHRHEAFASVYGLPEHQPSRPASSLLFRSLPPTSPSPHWYTQLVPGQVRSAATFTPSVRSPRRPDPGEPESAWSTLWRTIFGSRWAHLGMTLVLCWRNSGIIFGSFWVCLKSCWDPSPCLARSLPCSPAPRCPVSFQVPAQPLTATTQLVLGQVKQVQPLSKTNPRGVFPIISKIVITLFPIYWLVFWLT